MSQSNQPESVKNTVSDVNISPENTSVPLTETPPPQVLVPEQPVEASEVNPKENVEEKDNSFIWKILGGTLLTGGATALALGGGSKGGSSSSSKTNNQTTTNNKAQNSADSSQSSKGSETQSDTVKKAESTTNTSSSNNGNKKTEISHNESATKDKQSSQRDAKAKEETSQKEDTPPKEDQNTPANNEPPTITTKIYYPNGDVITHSGKTALDLNEVAYKTFSATLNQQDAEEEIVYINKDHPSFNGLKAGAEAYIAGKSQAEIQAIIEAAFQADSDNDGIIDSADKNPEVWNVSDRDLRMFSTLAYQSSKELHNIFNSTSPDQNIINKINKGDDNFRDAVNVEELTKYWDFIEYGDPGDGLQYVIFGNGGYGTQDNNGIYSNYTNVVIAFKGSKSPLDYAADIKIMIGGIPAQASYLAQIAGNLLEPENANGAKFKADNVYSTGHSLGGYLAQYFAAQTLQSDQELRDVFGHSTLFNPLPIQNNKHTAQARAETEAMLQKFKNGEYDQSTSAYVIKGELASNLYGTYDTYTQFIRDALWGKHDMSNFYRKNTVVKGNIKESFTNGYRMDNHYLNDDIDQDGLTDYQEAKIGTNIHLLDTDGDGITDAIEIKVGANALDKETTPWATGNGLSYFDETPMLITAEVIENGKTTINGIVLTPEQKADGVFYRVSEIMENLGVPSPLLHNNKTADNNLVQLSGSDGDDKIEIGSGSVLIQTGNGNDTIEFHSLNTNKVAYLDDFDISHDKLLFAKETFSDLNAFQYNQAQGQLSYNNTHFATFEQGLALDTQRFELI